MKFIKALVIGCMVLAAPFKVQALELSQQTDNVDVKLISSFEEINPNQNIEFIIRFEMKNGWHIFSQKHPTNGEFYAILKYISVLMLFCALARGKGSVWNNVF